MVALPFRLRPFPASLLPATVFAALVVFAAISGLRPASADERLHFETHIRPILKAHCWHCHGEETELRGKLDARFARTLLAGGDSGPAMIPGQHTVSLLHQRIQSGEMPPGERKVTADELQLLARWIDMGARTLRPEPEGVPAGAIIADEDRQHWAFQPITQPVVPEVSPSGSVRSPIDAFLLQTLAGQSLSFGPAADRETLLRRITIDLTGLPPTPAAIEQFLADPSPEAWNTVIDTLLNSPAYGERWARHWLDVAGYADSDGYTEKDPERPWAWKYRDYVIRSINADKPWNQFLVEQLAGDELLTPPLQNLSPEQSDLLTATGFLRMVPDGTADGGVDQPTARNDVIAETIRTVSTSLLGLSVGCAQCHQHRYDPISQEDYYRLRAVFEPAFDTTSWRPPAARLVSLWSAETQQAAADIDKELADISRRRTEELDGIVRDTFERELQKLPAERHAEARAVRETPAAKRSPEQQALIREFPFLNVDRGSVYLYLPDRLTGFNKKWDETTAAAKSRRPADDFVMCTTEIPGRIPATQVFFRGDHQQPRQAVEPGELAVLQRGGSIPPDDPALPTSGRRLAYARQLTDGTHPLLARVLVNRVWMHHFGRGLVATAADFGVRGERPSHPELLDWLATEFMNHNWSLKHLHRVILRSTAWQQSVARRPELDVIDPDNRLLGRMSIRRLEAETVRDSLLAISGQLNPRMYGKPAPVSPDDIGQFVIAIDTRDSAGRPSGKVESLNGDEFRRSLYVQSRRSMPLGVLEPFDLPRMTPNCEARTASTSPSQSLLMLNHPFPAQQAEAFAKRLQELSDAPATRIQLAWKTIFGRSATDTDLQSATRFLTEAASSGTSSDESTPLGKLCHAMFCSNSFLYVE
ncbi:MAG: PSD1 and planctomycete cytochrome C domain-containing protein [Planctomycetota bacterium]